MMASPLFLSLPTLAMRLGPLDFAQPLWLFALLLLLPIVYLWKTSRVPASPLRRWVALLLRSALILALILSLAGTRAVWFSKGICVVFVLDQSKSVPSDIREAVRNRLQDEIQKMTREDLFVVVEFGGDAILASLPSAKGHMPPPAQVRDVGRTDIARALRLAMASFPPDRQKRIVLFSDGNQNVGDALREARIAAAQNVDVDVLLLAAQQGHEVMVEQLVVPTHVRKDANFVLRAIISSDIAQKVAVSIVRDGREMRLPQESYSLKTGTNVLDFPDSHSQGGYHEYQLILTPAPQNDTFSANNTGYAFTTVDAPGNALVIRGKTQVTDYLSLALQSEGLTVDALSATAIPAAVKNFAAYDCVILDDVNAAYFSPTQMAELAAWVKDFGGGLIIIGGDDSFGPGGYLNTPLEDVAPVTMDVKRKKHIASLAVVIVNDKSGSMGMPAKGAPGLEKMDLANQGSVEVVKLLDSTDYAMIGAVDTQVKWMLESRLFPMTPTNKKKLIDNTLSCKAGGGGIYCETALFHAYELINDKRVNAMARHVIMFADAQDSEQKGDCIGMARTNYDKFGVTTSVIGLGVPTDPDVPWQNDVVKAGHGRAYITDDAMNLPRLFAKEAFLVSRKAYVEKPEGIPLKLFTSPLLQGFDRGVPRVYGYVGATLKPRATLAIHGEEPDDPVLSHWVTGLGKCVAYTSDSTSRWGKDWVAWEGYAKFWAQAVRWVSRSPLNNGLVTTTVIEGAEGHVILDAADESGKPINNLTNLRAKVIAPDQDARASDVELEQIAPGRYQGKFPASSRGTYLVSVYNSQLNQTLSAGGGVLSYPPEYRDLRPNAALLHSLADSTNGKFLSSIENVFEPKPETVLSFWPLWQALLIFLTSALLLDVAWRRLNIADWFTRTVPRTIPAFLSSTPAPATGANLGAFRTIKASRKDVDTQRQTLRDRADSLAESSAPPPMPSTLTSDSTSPATPESPTRPKPGVAEGYSNRLMDAKKRAAAQIRDQSDKPE